MIELIIIGTQVVQQIKNDLYVAYKKEFGFINGPKAYYIIGSRDGCIQEATEHNKLYSKGKQNPVLIENTEPEEEPETLIDVIKEKVSNNDVPKRKRKMIGVKLKL